LRLKLRCSSKDNNYSKKLKLEANKSLPRSRTSRKKLRGLEDQNPKYKRLGQIISRHLSLWKTLNLE